MSNWIKNNMKMPIIKKKLRKQKEDQPKDPSN